jgi:hypothetical protein
VSWLENLFFITLFISKTVLYKDAVTSTDVKLVNVIQASSFIHREFISPLQNLKAEDTEYITPLKRFIFRDTMLRSPFKVKRLTSKQSFLNASCWLFGLFFDLEDGGDIFLRKVY